MTKMSGSHNSPLQIKKGKRMVTLVPKKCNILNRRFANKLQNSFLPYVTWEGWASDNLIMLSAHYRKADYVIDCVNLLVWWFWVDQSQCRFDVALPSPNDVLIKKTLASTQQDLLAIHCELGWRQLRQRPANQSAPSWRTRAVGP